MSERATAESDVDAQLRNFTETIAESETYQQFVESQQQLKEDTEAQALFEEFREKQHRMQRGGFDQGTMSELRDIKAEMDGNETISEVREAENELIEMLRQTNEIISEKIGEEFAQTLGGGCC